VRLACGRVVRKVLSEQLLMPALPESLPCNPGPDGKKTARPKAFDAPGACI
jgi:hypothetical protein